MKPVYLIILGVAVLGGVLFFTLHKPSVAGKTYAGVAAGPPASVSKQSAWVSITGSILNNAGSIIKAIDNYGGNDD